MKFREIARAFAGAAVAVALCATTAFAAAASRDNQVVATVGNYKITEQDVNDQLKAQLRTLQVQLYDLQRTAVEELADDYLLQQAAKKAHLTLAAYLKREVDDKVAEPSDADLHKAYDQDQFHDPYDKVKPQLAAYLKADQAAQLRAQLIAKLRKEHGFKMLLKPPRFEVATGDSPALGPANAPVTIVEFGDFQAAACQRTEQTLKTIRDKYGDKLRLVFIDFPLASHQNAFAAAEAARCAGEQGKFWPFHDALYADQTKLGPNDLKATAARLKLDMAKFVPCLDQHKYKAAVQKDIDEGNELGVAGTPAFFINGRPLMGTQPAAKFAEVIDEELAAPATREARAKR